MNEVALHRGSSPHLNTIDIFVDGQHLTEAVVCAPPPATHLLLSPPVRWSYRINADWFYGLLSLRRWSHRPPFLECTCPYSNMST